MADLVAFMDILGTKARVRNGRFSSLEACEFVNPIGFMAQVQGGRAMTP
jgi:hypothetical protein